MRWRWSLYNKNNNNQISEKGNNAQISVQCLLNKLYSFENLCNIVDVEFEPKISCWFYAPGLLDTNLQWIIEVLNTLSTETFNRQIRLVAHLHALSFSRSSNFSSLFIQSFGVVHFHSYISMYNNEQRIELIRLRKCICHSAKCLNR